MPRIFKSQFVLLVLLRGSHLLSIRHNNIIHILIRPIVRKLFQIMLNSVDVMDIQKTALWFAKDTRIILNSVAFGRCIDYTEHFFEVVLNELLSISSAIQSDI